MKKHLPAQQRSSLFHADQAKSFRAGEVGFGYSASIILNRQGYEIVRQLQLGLDFCSLGMARHISKTFLKDAE